MSEVYQYQLDPETLKERLRPYLIDAMERASDTLLRAMKIDVHKKTHVGRTGKGAPGDPSWRDELDKDLRRLYNRYADDVLEIGVGADYGEGTPELVRAMIVAYGAGSAAGNSPIHAGPAGRSVWNDSLTGKKVSKVQDEYDLPDEFNQIGNNFVFNALRDTTDELNRIIEDAIKNVPSSVYMDALVRV